MLAGLVHCKRLSDRVAPDGTWCRGDDVFLDPAEAVREAELGNVEVQKGADLPPIEDPAFSSPFAGVDLASGPDLTAFVVVVPGQDGEP